MPRRPARRSTCGGGSERAMPARSAKTAACVSRAGAETVWPEQVERALATHPKIVEVAVAGRPHPERGQEVVAFVVPRTIDDPPSLGELRDHVRELLARYEAPRELVLVPELPRTSN